MQSTLNFSTSDASVLSQQLDTIVFSGLTFGDSLGVEITVYNGDTSTEMDSWYNTYYADRKGNIRLTDLARVWNSYIIARLRNDIETTAPATLMGGVKVKFSYTMEDETTATCYRHIWYATRDDGMTIANLNTRAPFVNLSKRTFSGATERFYVAGPTAKTLSIRAVYVRNNAVSTNTYTMSAASSDYFGRYFNVSPSNITVPSGASLKEYTVTVGSSVCTYYVEQGHYAQQTQFCYINRWGVYETVWCVGAETWTPEREATFGWLGDNYAALDVEVKDGYEVRAGYVDEATLDQLRDLQSSPSVWKWVASDSAWRKVAITGVVFERVKPSNEARTAIVNYQFAERNY